MYGTIIYITNMKYFKIREFTKSDVAKRNNINNSPSKREEQNIILLVDNILDPLREVYGKPIIVTSGFRCKRLNNIVGGSKKSQHCNGEAADIRSLSDSREENKKLFDLILELDLPFDQLINEYDYDWIHVSYSPRNRRQILNTK